MMGVMRNLEGGGKPDMLFYVKINLPFQQIVALQQHVCFLAQEQSKTNAPREGQREESEQRDKQDRKIAQRLAAISCTNIHLRRAVRTSGSQRSSWDCHSKRPGTCWAAA
jgi:hypothetical protein